MPYVTNYGSFSTNPWANSSHMLLTHPSVSDYLVLQEMPESATYSPPTLFGLPKASGRSRTNSLIITGANTRKLSWPDLAFVCSIQQVELLELLASVQTGAQPCTVVDDMLKPARAAVTKPVLISLASDKYSTIYSTNRIWLVQFGLEEI